MKKYVIAVETIPIRKHMTVEADSIKAAKLKGAMLISVITEKARITSVKTEAAYRTGRHDD